MNRDTSIIQNGKMMWDDEDPSQHTYSLHQRHTHALNLRKIDLTDTIEHLKSFPDSNVFLME